jgi:GTP-binding protein YchF
MLQAGIVGLPNVGKSTLFNALTRSRKAQAANYPFCTIDPNVGAVEVPDDRLPPLAKIAKTAVIIPAAMEFVDIAGLVAGASKGEGLGNKFLSHIREVQAVVHVVRCFEDTDIIHTLGTVDPIRDIEIISTELLLSDLDSAQSQLGKAQTKAKGHDKEAVAQVAFLERVIAHLGAGKPAHLLELHPEEKALMQHAGLLSSKPVLFACNVAEADMAAPDKNPHVARVREYAAKHHGAGSCVICAKIEEELGDLSPAEAADYLRELGVKDSGVSQLIRAAYALLGLASYFTAGEKEARAWTFHKGMTAPQCAGVIHSDFEKGFIKAEVVSYTDLVALGSIAAARDAGKYRLEGRDYLFQDGDVALFKFSS